ncbi:MAG: phosphoglycerate kinase [Magnetococcales bacterium]|nr:phosphoglycerate kinase [Magnetococcales bacterium]HIJ85528.1 phosphoglycerate kinase [Magnetococcales bacterium]
MNKLTIDDVSLKGKRVFIRVDFNVPMTESGTIREDTRIRGALPTIRKAIKDGGRVILASHMGRPKGKVIASLSLKPVAERLSMLLGQEVKLAPDCVGPEVEAMVNALKPGEVLLLENVRFHAGETKNDPALADGFARLADVAVNDAFGTAHRAHSSNVGVGERVPPSVAGYLMAAEIDYFNKVVRSPQRPVVSILGGAKVSSKIGVIEALMDKVDKIIIGGAMAFTFFKARGYNTGTSLVEDDQLQVARDAEAKAKAKGVQLMLPVDAICAQSMDDGAPTRIFPVTAIPDGWMGLDVGPETTKLFDEALGGVRTIVWNGPLGMFEKAAYATGTMHMAKTVSKSGAISVVGGGDTDAAVKQAGVASSISHISTGGGAFLELMEGKELPGVTIIGEKK